MLDGYTDHLSSGSRRRAQGPERVVLAAGTAVRIGQLGMMVVIALPLLLLLTIAALALGGLLVTLFLG